MNNLTVVENGLVNVYSGDNEERIVSGRELREFLGVSTNYTTWFKRMCEYGFEEGVDYAEFWSDSKNEIVAQKDASPQKMVAMGYSLDHSLKLDTAKEIAMIQRTEKGKMARQYFIEVEKKYQEMLSQPPTTLKALQSMINGMVEQERRTMELERQQEESREQFFELESKFNQEIAEEGHVSSNYIARELGIFSTSDRPHGQFIGAVAKQLKIYNNQIGYQDDYIKVIRATGAGGVVKGETYFSEKGYKLVKEFIIDKFKPYVMLYKRGEKKGKFNKAQFQLLGKNYGFNEKTSERYE